MQNVGRRQVITAIVAVASAFLGATAAHAQTFTSQVIDSRANIFDAGLAVANPGPAGVLPPAFTLAAGTDRVLTFSSVTGAINFGGGGAQFAIPNPDGSATRFTNIDSNTNVSGLQQGQSYGFLVGVFLGPGAPVGPAPAKLDFSNGALGTGFASLSPALQQTFFIGDGLTGVGAGTIQQFLVPNGATRLVLGLVDGFDNTNIVGAPNFYGDNVGSYTASFQVTAAAVPEGGAGALLAWGGLLPLAAAAVRRRFRRSA